jgi:hypothetical protein
MTPRTNHRELFYPIFPKRPQIKAFLKWGIPCSWYLHLLQNASVEVGVLLTKLMFKQSETAKIVFGKNN